MRAGRRKSALKARAELSKIAGRKTPKDAAISAATLQRNLDKSKKNDFQQTVTLRKTVSRTSSRTIVSSQSSSASEKISEAHSPTAIRNRTRSETAQGQTRQNTNPATRQNRSAQQRVITRNLQKSRNHTVKRAPSLASERTSLKRTRAAQKMSETEASSLEPDPAPTDAPRSASNQTTQQQVLMKIEENEEPAAKRMKQIFNLTEGNPTRTTAVVAQPPMSPKKVKGSLAVKFKSWNWTKQDVTKRPRGGEGEAVFVSSDEEPETSVDDTPVVVEQNNQRLQKCQMCLLYIPQDDFLFHETESCEALQTGDGREYICSECLAIYPSQKLLVRHKRECPRRSLSMYRYQSPRDGKALEGLYSVVWKCHCKQSFPSSDALGKHRLKCKFAQNYTVTCPICNSRIIGGQRVLRYHMSKNHPSLFLPDETSSSCILSSLQGTSTKSQVTSTQTTNIGKLVKKLSKQSQGANIRVVTLPRKDQQKKTSSIGTDIPISIPIMRPAQAKSYIKSPVVPKTVAVQQIKEEMLVQSPKTSQAKSKTTSESTKGKPDSICNSGDLPETVVEMSECASQSAHQYAQDSHERAPLRKRKVEEKTSEVATRKASIGGTQAASKPEVISILKTSPPAPKGRVPRVLLDAAKTSVEDLPVRVSQRNLARKALGQKSPTMDSQKVAESPVVTNKQEVIILDSSSNQDPETSEGNAEATSPVAGSSKETRATKQKEADEDVRAMNKDEAEESKEDLRNLLQKAKALTRELEEKLAKTSTLTDSPKPVERHSENPTLPSDPDEGKQRTERGPSAQKGVAAPTPKSKPKKDKKQTTPDVTPMKVTPRSSRRYSQVTCLDCHTVFKDHMALGLHKRSKCLGIDHSITEAELEAYAADTEKPKVNAGECYYCTICPSKFSLRSQLYVHMRDEHVGGLERYLNFHCPYCPRVFQTAMQRQSHKHERHEDLLKSSPDEEYGIQGVTSCTKCFAVFYKDQLQQHDRRCVSAVADTSYVSFCQLCGLVVENDQKLKEHRQKNHLSAIHFRCGQCTRTFGHALELRCHKVSHHSRSMRMDQVYQEMKRLEQRKNIKLGKSIKIHISPATPVKDIPVLKSPENSPATYKKPENVAPPEEKNTPTIPKPAGSEKIVASGKRPLSLTKAQMEMLSRGESIKLVIPKSTNMKSLSFSVPSADGKTKKFSLSPKGPSEVTKVSGDCTNEEPGSGVPAVCVVDGKNGRTSPEPQKELAAALGLQPADPENPAPAAEQHRPKRLRSGRTIENAVVAQKKDKDDGGARSISMIRESPQDDQRNDDVAEVEFDPDNEDPEIEDPEIENPEIEDPENMDPENMDPENMDPQYEDPENEVVVEEEYIETMEEDSKPYFISPNSGVPLPIIVMTKAEADYESPPLKQPTPNMHVVSAEMNEAHASTQMASRDPVTACAVHPDTIESPSLPPVQVLKPIGNDRVQCMRCGLVLGCMMEVANHLCVSQQSPAATTMSRVRVKPEPIPK